ARLDLEAGRELALDIGGNGDRSKRRLLLGLQLASPALEVLSRLAVQRLQVAGQLARGLYERGDAPVFDEREPPGSARCARERFDRGIAGRELGNAEDPGSPLDGCLCETAKRLFVAGQRPEDRRMDVRERLE